MSLVLFMFWLLAFGANSGPTGRMEGLIVLHSILGRFYPKNSTKSEKVIIIVDSNLFISSKSLSPVIK